MSLFDVWAAVETPAGKVSESRFTATPVGAVPPNQLLGFVQFVFPPVPLHVKLAGTARCSSSSTLRWGKGRNIDGLRADQPVHRWPRRVFDMSALPRTGEDKRKYGSQIRWIVREIRQG